MTAGNNTRRGLTHPMRSLRRMLEPSPEVVAQEDRRKAQLLLTLLLIVVPLGFVLAILYPLTRPDENVVGRANFLIQLGSVAVTVVCYVLSRTQHYEKAALLFVVSGCATILAIVIVDGAEGDINFLYYLVVPILFASLFFSERATLFILTCNMIVILFWAALVPEIDIGKIVADQIGFVVVVSGAALIVTRQRRLISEGQRAELAASEKRYRDLVELSPDAIVVHNGKEFFYVNPAGIRLMALSPEDALIGKPIASFWSPPMQQDVMDWLDDIISVKTPGRREDSIVLPDGIRRVFDIATSPVLYHGEPAQQVIARDITERKKTEQQLIQISTAVASASDAICIASEDGIVLYTNPAFADLFGYTVEDLNSGGGVPMMYKLPRQALSIYRDLLRGQPWQGEAELVTKTRRVITAAVRANPVYDADNTIIGILGVATDITEQKRLEAERREIELEHERIQLMRDFISGISHDIKTPLAVMKTKAYLLRRTITDDHNLKHIDSLEVQTDRLHALVETLLTMVRLDSAVPILALKPLNLAELLQGLFQQFESVAAEKHLNIAHDFPLILPEIYADPNELYRAFANLIENAIRYTPPGGSIMLRIYQNAHTLVSEISDSGIGISAEDKDHIFERFYRSDRARSVQTGGVGLGLAITKRIIEMHNGTIEVQSTAGKGSTFRVILPVPNAA